MSYVPDRLYARLWQPWTLPAEEHPRCAEDWLRVTTIAALPWSGRILDVGAGDGTLGAFLCSRHPGVSMNAVEPDTDQNRKAGRLWAGWPIVRGRTWPNGPFDGALCAEVLEHLDPDVMIDLLERIRFRVTPGGMCVFSVVPCPHGTRAAYPGHINLMTASELTQALEDAGYDVGDVRTIGDPAIWTMAVAYA